MRLGELEAKMKSMEAQVALSAGIAQSRTLTGPDGKEITLEGGPVVNPGSRHVYAQFQVGTATSAPARALPATVSARRLRFQIPHFNLPRNACVSATKTTSTLKWVRSWKHMLGDDPDVMDVTFKMTLPTHWWHRQAGRCLT